MSELLNNPYVSGLLVPVAIALLALFGWLLREAALLARTRNHAEKVGLILDTVGRKAGEIAQKLLQNPPTPQVLLDALKGPLAADAARTVLASYPAFAPAVGFTLAKLTTAVSDEVSRQMVASGRLPAIVPMAPVAS